MTLLDCPKKHYSEGLCSTAKLNDPGGQVRISIEISAYYAVKTQIPPTMHSFQKLDLTNNIHDMAASYGG